MMLVCDSQYEILRLCFNFKNRLNTALGANFKQYEVDYIKYLFCNMILTIILTWFRDLLLINEKISTGIKLIKILSQLGLVRYITI